MNVLCFCIRWYALCLAHIDMLISEPKERCAFLTFLKT